jgi:hypothetical protein
VSESNLWLGRFRQGFQDPTTVQAGHNHSVLNRAFATSINPKQTTYTYVVCLGFMYVCDTHTHTHTHTHTCILAVSSDFQSVVYLVGGYKDR